MANPSQATGMFSLYVHVPFCAALCDFCNFDKQVPTADDMRRLVDGVRRERENWGDLPRVDTVFWGGGTPGILRSEAIRQLAEGAGLTERRWREWTVEMTADCCTRQKLETLRELGVTRISFGVQSFQPRLLRAMGRPYRPGAVPKIVERIRALNFPSLNMDLIIAVPGQTVEELREDVRRTVELSPDHVSTYCLTVEDDTALVARLCREGYRPDRQAEAELYEVAWQELEAAGYRQYEISNFARPGHQSLHNRCIWEMGEWLGLGPSAASQFRGRRFRNPHGLENWWQALQGGRDRYEEVETVDAGQRSLDRVLFGLRLNEGVDLPAGAGLEDFVHQLAEEGLAEFADGRLRLTLGGRLLADAVSREILRIWSGRACQSKPDAVC